VEHTFLHATFVHAPSTNPITTVLEWRKHGINTDGVACSKIEIFTDLYEAFLIVDEQRAEQRFKIVRNFIKQKLTLTVNERVLQSL